ncbi:MAG TPA: hypothetical protein VF215_16865, partial [Thermoanaerobaculia bacterium]
DATKAYAYHQSYLMRELLATPRAKWVTMLQEHLRHHYYDVTRKTNAVFNLRLGYAYFAIGEWMRAFKCFVIAGREGNATTWAAAIQSMARLMIRGHVVRSPKSRETLTRVIAEALSDNITTVSPLRRRLEEVAEALQLSAETAGAAGEDDSAGVNAKTAEFPT